MNKCGLWFRGLDPDQQCFTTFRERGTPKFIFKLLEISLKLWHEHSTSRTSESCSELMLCCYTQGQSQKVISSVLWPRPLKPAGGFFVQTEVMCAVVSSSPRTLGGRSDGRWNRNKDRRVIRHQWAGPQKGRRVPKTPQQEVTPVLNSVLLHFVHLKVKRLNRHRWWSALGQGTAPSASTEGQRTLVKGQREQPSTVCSDRTASAATCDIDFWDKEKRCSKQTPQRLCTI